MKNPLNQYILYNDWGDFSRQDFQFFYVVRAERIELSTPTWKEGILPLN